jgi:hypothetical protein
MVNALLSVSRLPVEEEGLSRHTLSKKQWPDCAQWCKKLYAACKSCQRAHVLEMKLWES